VVIFSNCKINLGLHIVAKRADGFHDLETFFYPVPFYDVLEIIPAETFQFTTTGLAINGSIENNLCVKAYTLLKKAYPSLPAVHLHLQKNIPMGAGIGGGSANAAYTLLLLQKKFGLPISIDTLKKYALELGSDCPFFIENKPAFATGRGEVLEPIALSLENYSLVLLFPAIHSSTAKAFSQITPKPSTPPIKEIVQLPIDKWKGLLKNDFEFPIFSAHPTLAMLKEKLYSLNALYASMSGSGSTIYGFFPKNSITEEMLQKTFTEVAFKLL
jgi:4-diphosphocytidyl-2-C-methyl-D-erythritol kinase